MYGYPSRIDMVSVHVTGHEIYETLTMPEALVPKKGDYLWLGSLTRGVIKDDVKVSRVEWGMDQRTGRFNVWLKVRRTKDLKKDVE